MFPVLVAFIPVSRWIVRRIAFEVWYQYYSWFVVIPSNLASVGLTFKLFLFIIPRPVRWVIEFYLFLKAKVLG